MLQRPAAAVSPAVIANTPAQFLAFVKTDIARLGKVIRFRSAEVPAKEGVVQGVNCMALRADDTMAVINSPVVNRIANPA